MITVFILDEYIKLLIDELFINYIFLYNYLLSLYFVCVNKIVIVFSESKVCIRGEFT